MVPKIGIDCREFNIEFTDSGKTKKFRSMVGTAVVAKDLSQIKKEYAKSLRKGLDKLGLETDRKILCSFEILEMTHGDMSVHETIFDSLFPILDKINIFYTSFNTKRIPKIKTLGRIGTIEETFGTFFNKHLANSFPHICIWKIFDYIKDTEAEVYCDNFFTYTTEAWELIKEYDKVNILYNGDKSNILINIADIFLKVLESRLAFAKKSLYPPNIGSVLGCKGDHYGPKLYVYVINNKHYQKITPLDKQGYILSRHLKHPTYFVMKPKGGTINLDTILLRFPKMLNEIYDAGACITSFHERASHKLIKDNDIFIYLDDTGKTDIKTLQTLGHNIISKDIKEYK